MSQVNLNRLENFAPEVLTSCKHLLTWLETTGKGNLSQTEELRQAIYLLQEAGVQPLAWDVPTQEEIDSVLAVDVETEQEEAEGIILTDDMVWQELDDMIAGYKTQNKKASA